MKFFNRTIGWYNVQHSKSWWQLVTFAYKIATASYIYLHTELVFSSLNTCNILVSSTQHKWPWYLMKTKNKIQSKSYDSRKLFTVVHLTVTFIQSDVNYIQCIHFVFLASPFATVCATLLQLQHFTYIEAKSEPKDGAHLRWRRRWQLQCFASIHLANLRSLPNKTDKLLLLSQTNKGFSNCQNTDSILHVPPETVIYWITVTQQWRRFITLSHGQL